MYTGEALRPRKETRTAYSVRTPPGPLSPPAPSARYRNASSEGSVRTVTRQDGLAGPRSGYTAGIANEREVA